MTNTTSQRCRALSFQDVTDDVMQIIFIKLYRMYNEIILINEFSSIISLNTNASIDFEYIMKQAFIIHNIQYYRRLFFKVIILSLMIRHAMVMITILCIKEKTISSGFFIVDG